MTDVCVVVNGVSTGFGGTTVSVADVVRGTGAPDSGVAVAVDGQVVPRREWESTLLRGGEQVEVITAMQGG